jgi:putative ABC transport system permease protein
MKHDLRYALRQLLRSPGWSAVALLTIALGIGACTAIFSVVNTVLLRPLPYPESERLVVVRETNLPRFPEFSVAPGQYFAWRAQSRSWQSLAASRSATYNLTGLGEPQRVIAERVTANHFSTLGVRPALGRDFTAEEDVPGRENVVLLSHGFWQRQLGGRADVLQRALTLNGQPFTVIGVMPPGFRPHGRTEVYTPAAYTASDREQRGGHYISVFGRLAPGVTLEQARSEMAVIAERMARQYPATNQGWGVKLTPMLEAAVRDVKPVLFALLAAVGCLLLIACANVANLLLVRATGRVKEIAVRGALGAGRARIVRQLLTESLLLALLGAALGVVIAQLGIRGLMSLAPESVPRLQEVAIDLRALGVSVALAIVTGIAFGVAPARQLTRPELSEALKQAGRGAGETGHRHRLRGALVVAEMAIALVLLVGAGLLMRSFVHLQSVDPGFEPQQALAARVSLPEQKYDSDAKQALFADQALRQLAALPGVQAAGAVQVAPLSGSDYLLQFSIKGRPPIAPSDLPPTHYYAVSPGYFRAMGIRLLRGRLFEATDTATSPPVAIIGESMARKFFPGQDPLGQYIMVTQGPDRWRQIVGVVRDVRHYDLHREVTVQTYEPLAQQPFSLLTFVVRAGGSTEPLPAAIRRAIYAVDADQPVARIQPLTQWVAESMGRQRFAMLLFAVFSGAALLLAAIGIYGVMAYSVRQRRGEIGIRMALGAGTAQVLRLVCLQGGRLIVLGLGLGIGGALLLTRFLSTMLFGVSAQDPLTFGVIALLLAIAAALACLLPARRAAGVNPMTALRSE